MLKTHRDWVYVFCGTLVVGVYMMLKIHYIASTMPVWGSVVVVILVAAGLVLILVVSIIIMRCCSLRQNKKTATTSENVSVLYVSI